MSEIKKYKKALNYRANPRYLSRDFIVPLYTGTEPDIIDDSNTQQGTGSYTPFPNEMPIITPKDIEQQPYEQLKLNKGGRVGFAPGGIVNNKEKLKKLEQIILESNSNPFKSISKNQAVLNAGYKNPSNLETRKKIKNLLDTLIPLEEKFSNHLNNVMNNLDNIPYQEIVKEGGLNKYVSKPFGVDRIAGSRKINNAYSKPEFKEARDIVRLLSNAQVFETYGNKEMFAGEVLDNLDVKKSATRLRGGKLEDDIVNVAMRSAEAGNKNIRFLTKPGTVDSSDIVFEWNGKLYGKNIDQYKGKKVNNLTTDLYKLPEFNEYLNSRNKLENLKEKPVIHPVTGKETTYDQLLRETYAKGFGNNSFYKFSGLDLDHKDIKNKPFSDVRPLPRHINAAASPLNKKTFSIVKDKEKFLQEVGYNIPEESLEKSIVDFSDRVLNKKIPINKTYQSGLQSITGASKEYLTPLSKIKTEGLEMEKKGAKEFIKGETQVMTSSGKYRDVSEKERIPKEFSEQKKNTVEYLTDYLNKNQNEVKALRAAGIVCRRDTGGGIDTECLAENVVKEIKKLEAGTDLQKTSVLNKLNNAVKLGSGLAEELILFGKGVAGRTIGPLVALNSALEQWTSGDIKQGFRKIADVFDPTTIVGDTFGLGKMRTEGTQEDIKKIIGEKNYKGFENVKAAADEYNQYLDVSKKLERAKSAAEGAYDPLSLDVDTSYLTDLEKQKSILEKNITGTKYKDVQDNIINYGKNIYENILKQRPDAPPSSKYVYKKAAIEKLEDAFGKNIIDLYKDQINSGFGPDLNVIDTQQENMKPLSEEDQNSSESYGLTGAAKGGRIGYKDGTDDPNEKPFIPIDPLSDDTKPKNIMDTKLTRREILGGMGVAAGVPIIAKLINEGKAIKAGRAAKVATKVLPKVSGMPEWFPSLVSKIEKEGKFPLSDYATTDNVKIKELSIPSKTGKGPNETYIMTKYPNGKIEIHADIKGGAYDQPFELHYTPPESFVDETTGKVIKHPGDFSIVEQRPKVVGGPHDADYEFDWENVSKNQALSDIERVEKTVTGKIANPKEAETRAAQRDYYYNSPYEDIVDRSGDIGLHYDDIAKEEFTTGGRVGFGGGGHPAIKFARMITDLLRSLKQDLSSSSHLEKLYGPEYAKKHTTSPYRIPEGTNKSRQSDILMRIDEIKQNLPKEYSGLINTLDDIEKKVSDHNYIDAYKKGTNLLDNLPESFNFEKLPQELFPMEDPLNSAFIIFDPKREKMVGRYTMRYAVDPETGKGIIQTYDTYDPVSKKFLEEKDWKLIGVDAREESGEITKKGLN